MIRSHVVVVDGVFVGAAIQYSDGYRFVAVGSRLAELNGTTAATLHETRSLAVRALRSPKRRPVADGMTDVGGS